LAPAGLYAFAIFLAIGGARSIHHRMRARRRRGTGALRQGTPAAEDQNSDKHQNSRHGQIPFNDGSPDSVPLAPRFLRPHARAPFKTVFSQLAIARSSPFRPITSARQAKECFSTLFSTPKP